MASPEIEILLKVKEGMADRPIPGYIASVDE